MENFQNSMFRSSIFENIDNYGLVFLRVSYFEQTKDSCLTRKVILSLCCQIRKTSLHENTELPTSPKTPNSRINYESPVVITPYHSLNKKFSQNLSNISKTETFKFSLFSCYEEKRLFFLTTIFPCLTFGIVAERSGFGDGYKYIVYGVFSFILLLYSTHFLIEHNSTDTSFYPTNVIGLMNFTLLILSVVIVVLFIGLNFFLRRWIRRFTDLRMNTCSVKAILGDLMVSLWCVPCSIIQLSRQLHAAEVNPHNYFEI